MAAQSPGYSRPFTASSGPRWVSQARRGWAAARHATGRLLSRPRAGQLGARTRYSRLCFITGCSMPLTLCPIMPDTVLEGHLSACRACPLTPLRALGIRKRRA